MKTYFRELSVIILGVTIALVVENVNAYFQQKLQLDDSLEAVRVELEEHSDRIANILQLHQVSINEYDVAPAGTYAGKPSLNNLFLSNSAYKVLLNNGSFEVLEKELAADLIDYYAVVESFYGFQEMYFKSYNHFLQTGETAPVFIWLKEMNQIELQMFQENSNLLDQLMQRLE